MMEVNNNDTEKKKKPLLNKAPDVRKMTYLAILTAIVFVLQFIPVKFTLFSLTFVLVPIVIGVALCGTYAGAWLGFIFGVAVLVSGDAALFMGFNVFGTIVTVLLKGTVAGLAAGLVFRLLEKKNRYLAVVIAAITTPIVNTGIFFLGCTVFFFKDIQEFWSLEGGAVVPFIVTGLIGINFIIEVVVNMVLVPSVYRLINIKKKKVFLI